jgi:1-acyl-sn-glycerol-3-phosphate acyltransferase
VKAALRLARVFLHLFEGLATCALIFPFVGGARRDALVRAWSRRLLAICGVRLAQQGAPLAHALLVANHLSWLDIFVINAVAPSRFVAKAEIRSWPALGWLVAQAGTVFIARGSRRDLRATFKGIVEQLQQGARVAFFPEGTTAAQGTLLPFHANLFEAAIDAAVPVQPLALAYLDAAGAPHAGIDFTGDISFATSMLTILKGPPIHARLHWLAPIEGGEQQRRVLCEAARHAIGTALGVPLAPHTHQAH